MWTLSALHVCNIVIDNVNLPGQQNCLGLKILMFLPTEAKKSLPATKQKLWQTTLTTVFHQQTKYGANSPEAQHYLRKPKNIDFFVVSSS